MDTNEAMSALREIQVFKDNMTTFINPAIRAVATVLTETEKAQKILNDFEARKKDLEQEVDSLTKKRMEMQIKEKEYRTVFETRMQEMDQQKVAMNQRINELKEQIQIEEDHLNAILAEKTDVINMKKDIAEKQAKIEEKARKRGSA